MDSQTLIPVANGVASLSASLMGILLFALIGHADERLRAGRQPGALGWLAALSLAGGSGLWAMLCVALAGMGLPWDLQFRPAMLAASWGVAIVGMAGVLSLSLLWPHRPWLRVPVQAGVLGGLWLLASAVAAHALLWPAQHRLLDSQAAAVGAIALGALVGLGGLGHPRFSQVARVEVRVWVGALAFGLLCGLAAELSISALAFAPPPAGPRGEGADPGVVWLLCGAGTGLLVLGVFGALADAGSRRRQASLRASLNVAQERLREQALSDPLTRLPNRALFEERLAQQLEQVPAGERESLAVLFIDLDGFKPVNDSFGHAAGDSVLAEVGERLRSLVEPQDLAARVGGDEFLLLLQLDGDATRGPRTAQAVLKAISRPYRLPNLVEVNLSCSIGIVTYPAHGPGNKLIANADAAMYAAKRAGGSSFAVFAPSMDQDARLQLELQHDLRTAIERHELELYYQPKVHALSGQITGAEALVRWNHPTRGMISPAVFIPVAERFALISALGYWVIEDACRQVREWLDQGLRMRVAVNLSMQQLRQDDLVPRIRAALERFRIEPSLLTFEITESVAMEDNTLRALGALSGVGVSLSIDDFGTAYSNFAALRKLPAKQLKIDRSLFTDIDESGDALAVVDAMIKMAHALGLKVVAEGVETERQRDLLLALHCDEFQGYLYGRPMPAAMLSLWALGEGETHPVDFRASLYDPRVLIN
ncbi:EAL domain-containing protein [Ideonella sp. 4Y11]|uniref:EAL domain-containing protein n=1 Tax=Ideonella aquatica TaxID=2824119 RepID=A0A940YPV2_9BURK|nr:EAL domain-containing protein [Ideonella aquatica]MBQ0961834.1 EAL domain-containing protein [Ideonella aquatica]